MFWGVDVEEGSCGVCMVVGIGRGVVGQGMVYYSFKAAIEWRRVCQKRFVGCCKTHIMHAQQSHTLGCDVGSPVRGHVAGWCCHST